VITFNGTTQAQISKPSDIIKEEVGNDVKNETNPTVANETLPG